MKTWDELLDECADLADATRAAQFARRARGAAEPRFRGILTPDQRRAIIEDPRASRAVAKDYGVSHKYVCHIRKCAK